MKNITLSDEQALAFDGLFAFATGHGGSALAVLEGFAGTGKTTLVSHLLQSLPMHLRVAVMAPTNKAVGVLQEKIKEDDCAPMQAHVEFGSLHSFLGLRLKEREDGSQSCDNDGQPTLHEYDLAVIDEASMVSSQLFEFVLRHKRTCKVLFVGDPAQLPPVDDGGMDSPVFRMVNLKYRLNEIMRQVGGNPIIQASMVVRQAIEQGRRITLQELLDAFPKTKPCAVGLVYGGVGSIVSALASEHRAKRNCRALAWRNVTVQDINARTHTELFQGHFERFCVGEILIANDEFKGTHNERVFNSEELTVLDVHLCQREKYPIDGGSYELTLQRDSGAHVKAYCAANEHALRSKINMLWNQFRAAKAQRKAHEASVLSAHAWALTHAYAPLRHTYAVTSHKSQGSTFDTALLDWDDMMLQRNDFEFNRMVYVAMTRASKFMAIFTKNHQSVVAPAKHLTY